MDSSDAPGGQMSALLSLFNAEQVVGVTQLYTE